MQKEKNNKNYEDEHPVPLVHEENPVVRAIINQAPSDTDPNGSYTGKPEHPDEMPQQDADDL